MKLFEFKPISGFSSVFVRHRLDPPFLCETIITSFLREQASLFHVANFAQSSPSPRMSCLMVPNWQSTGCTGSARNGSNLSRLLVHVACGGNAVGRSLDGHYHPLGGDCRQCPWPGYTCSTGIGYSGVSLSNWKGAARGSEPQKRRSCRRLININ